MSKGTLNKAIIIGRLGKDPTLKYLPSGDAVASFGVATNDNYKDKEGKIVENTDWHNVSAFGKLAEICGQYLKQGSLVYVEGKLKTRKYTTKDGIEKTATEIKAESMQMLGDKKEVTVSQTETHGREAQVPNLNQKDSTDQRDDLPF
ncbi:MAG TPA: single-stranded DNA-binding protein [Nitrosomonas sp.]|nr:single-stranded DNA-binding protein [Nitrosomonas sp.]